MEFNTAINCEKLRGKFELTCGGGSKAPVAGFVATLSMLSQMLLLSASSFGLHEG